MYAFVIVLGGVVLVVLGLTFIVLARRELARQGQPTDPGLPTSKLVTTGVFSVSRNPLYLGGICLLAGIAFVLNLPWSLVLLLPAFVTCHYLLVAPEERYLAAKFGIEYAQYAASVRRWLGHARLMRLRITHEIGWLRGVVIGLISVVMFFIMFLAFMREAGRRSDRKVHDLSSPWRPAR